jgi:uncharacterized protein YbjT (DUF2867 family)
MILVTGASGNVGGAVMQAVIAGNHPVRAMYRSEADAENIPRGASVVVADFGDRRSLAKALDGITRVFLVCAPIPQLVELETNVIELCRQRDLEHLVLNSALGAGTFDASFPAWHRKVERNLERSGVAYSVLRPNSFMQNVANFYAPTIRSQGVFYAALEDAPISYIDVRDVGAFAARLLAGEPGQGRTYELNGPEALTCNEIAVRLSRFTGRPVRYVNVPPAELKKSVIGVGMPQWQVDALLELQHYYVEGNGGQTDNVVRQMLGRDPIVFEQFLRDYAVAFQQAA